MSSLKIARFLSSLAVKWVTIPFWEESWVFLPCHKGDPEVVVRLV